MLNCLFALYISMFYVNYLTKTPTEPPVVSSFKPAVGVGYIKDVSLAEASGIIASGMGEALFWVINDSGNEPKLFLINRNGETVHSYWIDGMENRDWEDLAACTDKATGKRKLYIGDIGDNYAIRDHINVIVMDEPVNQTPEDTIIYNFQNYLFRYEDGPRDAETILVDPSDSKIRIISKREEHVRIYEAPAHLSSTDTMQLIYKSSLPIYNVTSGDISSDGKEIIIKSYSSIYYWKKDQNTSVLDAFNSDFELLEYVPEPQGESICWSLDGNGFYTLSEKSWSAEQVVYFYERIKP